MFIAHGTLINKKAASQILDPSEERKPVHAFGVRRVFNFVLEDQNYDDRGGNYRRSKFKNHSATLNIQQTGDEKDIVNGILMSVNKEGIDAIAKREAGYDIITVGYALIGGAKTLSNAYMFMAREESPEIGHRVRDDILPNESALETCLVGATDYGRNFLDTWIRHCYLADSSPLLDHDYYRELINKKFGRNDSSE